MNPNYRGRIIGWMYPLIETCNIPPRSEIIVILRRSFHRQLMYPGLTEFEEDFTKSARDLVEKTLVSSSKRVPLRKMSATPYIKVVQTWTVVASISPVEEVAEYKQS